MSGNNSNLYDISALLVGGGIVIFLFLLLDHFGILGRILSAI